MAVWLTMNMSYVGQGDYSNSSKIAVSVDVHWSHVSYNRDGGSLTVTVDGVSDYRTVAFNAGETSSGSQNIYSSYWDVAQPGGAAKTVSAYATFQATNNTAATPASGSLYLSSTGGSSGGSSGGGDSGGEDGGDTGESPGTNPGGGSGNYEDEYEVYTIDLYCKDSDGTVLAMAMAETSAIHGPDRIWIGISYGASDSSWRIRQVNTNTVVLERADGSEGASFFATFGSTYVFEVLIGNEWIYSSDGSGNFCVEETGLSREPNNSGDTEYPDEYTLRYIVGSHCRVETYFEDELFESIIGARNKSTTIKGVNPNVFTFVFIADDGYKLSECSINGVACGSSGSITTYNEEYVVVASAVSEDYLDGVVYIDNDSEHDVYYCYIDNGAEYTAYHCYIDNGSSWNILGGDL